MGVNWDSGVLFWQDHAPSANERYTLSHLHPFVQRTELAATDKNPTRKAKLYVAFGLHTFTRAAFTSMRYWATCSAEQPRASLPEIQASWPLKHETPLEAGFRHSGSAYLPPGQTSCEAGVHLAGFCAQGNCKSAPVV